MTPLESPIEWKFAAAVRDNVNHLFLKQQTQASTLEDMLKDWDSNAAHLYVCAPQVRATGAAGRRLCPHASLTAPTAEAGRSRSSRRRRLKQTLAKVRALWAGQNANPATVKANRRRAEKAASKTGDYWTGRSAQLNIRMTPELKKDH